MSKKKANDDLTLKKLQDALNKALAENKKLLKEQEKLQKRVNFLEKERQIEKRERKYLQRLTAKKSEPIHEIARKSVPKDVDPISIEKAAKIDSKKATKLYRWHQSLYKGYKSNTKNFQQKAAELHGWEDIWERVDSGELEIGSSDLQAEIEHSYEVSGKEMPKSPIGEDAGDIEKEDEDDDFADLLKEPSQESKPDINAWLPKAVGSRNDLLSVAKTARGALGKTHGGLEHLVGFGKRPSSGGGARVGGGARGRRSQAPEKFLFAGHSLGKRGGIHIVKGVGLSKSGRGRIEKKEYLFLAIRTK